MHDLCVLVFKKDQKQFPELVARIMNFGPFLFNQQNSLAHHFKITDPYMQGKLSISPNYFFSEELIAAKLSSLNQKLFYTKLMAILILVTEKWNLMV